MAGESPEGVAALSGSTVFRATEYSLLHAVIAFAFLFGSIHPTAALSVAALLCLPSPRAFGILGLLLFFMLIPLDKTSKQGQKLARYMCKYACGYFPVTLYVEDLQAFDPGQAYVFACEPHGVFPLGVLALSHHMGYLPLPKVKFLASSAVVYLKNRKGFVRVAMETGRPLVPVFSFGQSRAFHWWKPGGKIYTRLARTIKFAPILFWGAFGSPMPCQHPMHVFVGRPIEVKKNPQPTMEEVDEVHNQFVAALQEIFQRHKSHAGHPELELRII